MDSENTNDENHKSKEQAEKENALLTLCCLEKASDKAAKRQKIIIALCIVIIILLLLMSTAGIMVITNNHYLTEQTGLIALVDTPVGNDDIPDFDPDAIHTPDPDRVQDMNDKLDKGKMCINMSGTVTLGDSYGTGYFGIKNSDTNNYPQFVKITLDSNGTEIYKTGLIEVGDCILYDGLDVVLEKGTYNCTATFSQVDTDSMKICGKASAKVIITVNN